MTTSSVSFRITRHTEDLAQTIHALSQRVVRLEQHLARLEEQLAKGEEEELPAEQLTSLENVDQLLRDCRELLAVESRRGASGSDASSGAAGLVASAEKDRLDDRVAAA